MFSLRTALIKFLDRHPGNFLCTVLSVFNRKKNFTWPDKILVVQLWGVGETILTLPSIRALRKKFPKARITVLTTAGIKDVFFEEEDIESTIAVGLNPLSILKFVLKNYRKYDLVVDFEEYLNISAIISFFAGEYRIGFSHGKRSLLYDKRIRYDDEQHVMRTFLDLVGVVGADYKTDRLVKLKYSNEDKGYVESLLKTDVFTIGIAPGVADSARSRMWPMGRFAELADRLIEKYNSKIVFVGGKREIKLINRIGSLIKNKDKALNLAGKTDLRQLFYLIEKCDIFISNDTGPMHIAAAQGVKTIGLFGPNLPERFGPFGKGNISVYKEQECSPCINVHKGEVPECKWKYEDYQKCMKAITVEDVLRAVERVK